MYQLTRRVYGLYPTLEDFNGTVLIILLNLMATLAEEFDIMEALEATAVFMLT